MISNDQLIMFNCGFWSWILNFDMTTSWEVGTQSLKGIQSYYRTHKQMYRQTNREILLLYLHRYDSNVVECFYISFGENQFKLKHHYISGLRKTLSQNAAFVFIELLWILINTEHTFNKTIDYIRYYVT